MTPLAAARMLGGMAATIESGMMPLWEEVGRIVEKEAKAMIGNDDSYHYNISPFATWEPLHQTTLDDKISLGISPPDRPLFRTGEMQDSIEHSAEPLAAHIFSDDPVAKWQELGTPNIAPRSFIGGAIVRKDKEIFALIATTLDVILAGRTSSLVHRISALSHLFR
jgi:hypothetical protein